MGEDDSDWMDRKLSPDSAPKSSDVERVCTALWKRRPVGDEVLAPSVYGWGGSG